MPLMKFKPTSPGRRSAVRVVTPDLHKGAPHAALLDSQSKSGGRNHHGRITVRHVGGGHKQHYRIIDFKRNKEGIPARVERIEYDPNRTAHIALLCYVDGERRYIIAPKGLKAGDQVIAGANAPIKTGNTLPLRNIPVGTTVHGIELKPGKALRSHVLPVQPSSWSLAKASMPRCVCARAKCARCRSSAAPPSAKSATTSTTSRSWARLAPSAGAVFVRPFAVRP
ncbi:hypothetical protein XPN_0954 [Xanthomonas arboricola pv. pruni MAFF 301427]|nr:hypothetical protein XPN_0954 [Xanthomonas arboricola pv. pruni MAFF 301427]